MEVKPFLTMLAFLIGLVFETRCENVIDFMNHICHFDISRILPFYFRETTMIMPGA
jgi:hypothetical protein